MKPIFIHIPKTAGTSISSLPVEYDFHNYPENVLKKVGIEHWNQAFKFTVIRHPCDRLISAYYYMLGINIREQWIKEVCLKENHTNPIWWSKLPNDNFWGFDARESMYCKKFSSLEDFLLNGQLMHWLHFIPQINWLRLPLDKVIHYETVNEEIKEVLPQKLPHKRHVEHPSWHELFTPQMMQKMQELYKEDFEFEKNMPNSMWELIP